MLSPGVMPSFRFPARLTQLGAERSAEHVYDRTLYAYREEVRDALSQFRAVELQRNGSGMSNVEVLILPIVEACYKGMCDEDGFSFEHLHAIVLSFLRSPRMGLEVSRSRVTTRGMMTFVVRQKVEKGGRANDFQAVRIRVCKGRRRTKPRQ